MSTFAKPVAARRIAAATGLSGSSISGAAIVGGVVTIVTIGRGADGQWFVDPHGSGEFKLSGRDQASVQSFHSAINTFISNTNISELFLRVGPRAGPLSGIVESHVCEAALCLSALRVHQVSAFSIAPRMRAANLEFGTQKQERARQYALAAAYLGAERISPSRGADHERRAAIRLRYGRA